MNGDADGALSIGAVSRVTGLPEYTLRAWERRYGAVEPARRSGGGRLYSREDVARLQLIKRLTDLGQAVSTVAGLATPELRQRVSELEPLPATTTGPRFLAVQGQALAQRLRLADPDGQRGWVVAEAEEESALVEKARAAEADALVLSRPTLHADTAQTVQAARTASGAGTVMVVYRFGARAALDALAASRIPVLRGPADAEAVLTVCSGSRPTGDEEDLLAWALEQPARERRFSDAELGRLASLSPAMQCECPNHMADLIAGLAAFERYSGECENRSPEDASLHAMLHAVTGQARGLMEQALERLVAAEGLEPRSGEATGE